jgi:hypothetical protein
MIEPLVIVLLLGGFGAVAWGGFRRPRGVYWKSAASVAAVVLGWAALWLIVSPSNEAGFGFFAIWVVLTAIALLLALAACAGATARHVVERVARK